jgi:predicted RNA-binding Zn-ribbon protein involved in translation (DUF1610 family)
VNGKMLVKVIKLNRPKTVQTKFGPRLVQGIEVKDLASSKNTMSLWPPFSNSVSEGRVYIISKMMTESYPKLPPYYLASTRDTVIIEAPEVLAMRFVDITFDDGRVEGPLAGFQNVYTYESCLSCHRRIKQDPKTHVIPTHCATCGRDTIDKCVNDFMFVVVIHGIDGVCLYYTGFKRFLNLHVENVENDLIEQELTERFLGKITSIAFSIKKGGDGKETSVINTIEIQE